MATKQVVFDDIGVVTFYKRKKCRSIRISLTHEGNIRVTMPTWVPYQAGINFVRSKVDWIKRQQVPAQTQLQSGQAIGKAHHLLLQPHQTNTRISSRLSTVQAIVTYPAELTLNDSRIQASARAVCIRALRRQAEQLLPQRLASLAKRHGFDYNSVHIRQLKSRWGSCSQATNITLNLFLMQLPWHLIDYVLLHELAHTRRLHHGSEFWQELERVLPNAKQLRREIRLFRPVL